MDDSELRDKTLYLDGLDEQRASEKNGADVLDQIITRLRALGRPMWRLSCRTADWFGELDRSNLRDAANGDIRVVRLTPLTETQVLEIVRDRGMSDREFQVEAMRSGIEEWLTNPQSLLLVLEVVSGGAAWPKTRRELFERACNKLILEENESRRRAAEPHSPVDLLRAAGLVCIVLLRANLEGVALERSQAGEGYPALSTLPETVLPLADAARTKLFRHPAPERAVYYHRTMAEFLAARYLVEQIQNGVPAERVRRMLTASSGRVPTELRGLYAWVATLCPDPAKALFIRADPLGLALYGDPAFLSPSYKQNILDSLALLAEEDSWFFGGYWQVHPLGRLSDKELRDYFEKVLSEWQTLPGHFLYIVLNILRFGRELVVSPDAVLAFIRQHRVPEFLRRLALRVFVTHCNKRKCELLPLP